MAAYAVSKQRGGIFAAHVDKSVKLSNRQGLILSLLAQGHSRDQIAEKTGLTVNTVKTHLKLIYEKLGVSSAAAAVIKARELGIRA